MLRYGTPSLRCSWLLVLVAMIMIMHGEVASFSIGTARTAPKFKISRSFCLQTHVNGEKTHDSFKYIKCIKCRSCYKYPNPIPDRGVSVQCSACSTQWQLQRSAIYTGDSQQSALLELDDRALEEIAKLARAKKKPVVKPFYRSCGVFVSNIPTTYNEADVGDLFAEYGVFRVAVKRDVTTQKSRGFAFLEVADRSIAEQVVREMNNFCIDSNKRLSVQLIR